MTMQDKVEAVFRRHDELEQMLASSEIASDPSKMEKLGREYNSIHKNIPVFKKYMEVAQSIEDATQLLNNESDEELLELAQEELRTNEELLPELEQQVKRLLVPRDPKDLRTQ